MTSSCSARTTTRCRAVPARTTTAPGWRRCSRSRGHSSPSRLERTVRFVAFVNEEPPFFQGPEMGSVGLRAACTRSRRADRRHALARDDRLLHRRADGLSSIPPPLRPALPQHGQLHRDRRGSPVAPTAHARGDARSARRPRFPSNRPWRPPSLPGVGWSDHWAFWQEGYPAIMLTDTAPYRYPHYHTAHDTPDQLRYPQFAQVVAGVIEVTRTLAAPIDDRCSAISRQSASRVGPSPAVRYHATTGNILAKPRADHGHQYARAPHDPRRRSTPKDRSLIDWVEPERNARVLDWRERAQQFGLVPGRRRKRKRCPSSARRRSGCSRRRSRRRWPTSRCSSGLATTMTRTRRTRTRRRPTSEEVLEAGPRLARGCRPRADVPQSARQAAAPDVRSRSRRSACGSRSAGRTC